MVSTGKVWFYEDCDEKEEKARDIYCAGMTTFACIAPEECIELRAAFLPVSVMLFRFSFPTLCLIRIFLVLLSVCLDNGSGTLSLQTTDQL